MEVDISEEEAHNCSALQQEILDGTFALLADEEENEGNRNAIFGDCDPIPLHCITQNGGTIPLLHIFILRAYPIIYMRKNEQGRNGKLPVHLYLRFACNWTYFLD